MRLPDDRSFASLTGAALLLSTTALAACASGGVASIQGASDMAAGLPSNGPHADYPQVVGDPYQVNGVPYTPIDTLNYDDVGMVVADLEASRGATGAHHTLPVPSYVEVTSLETGRTILVRIERRGPMESNALLSLSPAAIAQLGGQDGIPVRVRRVNPPEEERYALRSGQTAPLRMDTPMSLVRVLRRKLPDAYNVELAQVAAPETVSVPLGTLTEESGTDAAVATIEAVDPGASTAPGTPAAAIVEAEPVLDEPALEVEAIATVDPAPTVTPSSTDGGFLVQAAAFSTEERARNAATSLQGFVLPSGRFWRVRTGPFATRGEAEASLANVRNEGYTDARILTSG